MRKVALIALPLLFGGLAHAESNPNIYNFNGGYSCQKLVVESSSDDKFLKGISGIMIMNYMKGYISAFNTIYYNEKKIPYLFGNGIKNSYMIEYAKNYCLNNPNSDLADATKKLIMDLIK
ncbi:hypothetical protein IGS75_14415 (plasmid) [Gluconobacter sphaericus]|uniref:hypothetical protein n=1 Tax=Gluconobacter sphaericus TaxID=574987 RepID=UPI001922C8AB|nr:hypothetical protein [Gluconobacter sphaericus]QQX92712.1 hypothetical protein IGS75_14415 [Gluconobacter sphaericus]